MEWRDWVYAAYKYAYIIYSIPPLLRGFWDERKIREKPRKSGGPRNSGDAQKAPGYGILAIILSKTSDQVFY